MSVPEYTVLLADNSQVVSNQKVEADLTLITRTGKVLIPGIIFNVIPGPPAPLLIGEPELKRLGIPHIWTLIEQSIKKKRKQKACASRGALAQWKERRIAMSKDEPENLVGVDELYAHGASTPTKEQTRNSIQDILTRAKTAGASHTFLQDLKGLILNRFENQWRLMLGLDSPARMEPMVIKFNEGKFPNNIQPRKYGPEQRDFLKETIPRMLDAGILERSNSRFGCCPFTPFKADGSLRFCLDSRPQNKVMESTKFPIPDMHAMVQSLNGSKFFACLDAAEGYFQCPLSPCSYKYQAVLTHGGVFAFTRLTMGCKTSGGSFAYR